MKKTILLLRLISVVLLPILYSSCNLSESVYIKIIDFNINNKQLKAPRGTEISLTAIEKDSLLISTLYADGYIVFKDTLKVNVPLIGFYWDDRLIDVDDTHPFEFSYRTSIVDTLGSHKAQLLYSNTQSDIFVNKYYNIILE